MITLVAAAIRFVQVSQQDDRHVCCILQPEHAFSLLPTCPLAFGSSLSSYPYLPLASALPYPMHVPQVCYQVSGVAEPCSPAYPVCACSGTHVGKVHYAFILHACSQQLTDLGRNHAAPFFWCVHTAWFMDGCGSRHVGKTHWHMHPYNNTIEYYLEPAGHHGSAAAG